MSQNTLTVSLRPAEFISTLDTKHFHQLLYISQSGLNCNKHQTTRRIHEHPPNYNKHFSRPSKNHSRLFLGIPWTRFRSIRYRSAVRQSNKLQRSNAVSNQYPRHLHLKIIMNPKETINFLYQRTVFASQIKESHHTSKMPQTSS